MQGADTGMKIRPGRMRRQYAHIRRQQSVEAVSPAASGSVAAIGSHGIALRRETAVGNIAVHDLSVGVNARIGAPGTMQTDMPPRNTGNGRFKNALHRKRGAGRFLNLPAAEAGSLIGKKKSEAHYSADFMREISSENSAVFSGLV